MITKQVPPPYQQDESCLKHLEAKGKIYLDRGKNGFCDSAQSWKLLYKDSLQSSYLN